MTLCSHVALLAAYGIASGSAQVKLMFQNYFIRTVLHSVESRSLRFSGNLTKRFYEYLVSVARKATQMSLEIFWLYYA